jgi:LysM repeat protein
MSSAATHSATSCINFTNQILMKFQTLPVKRRPVSKGIFRRLNANTRNRRQRVAAAGSAPVSEMEAEDHSSRISRALTIIFLIHIVAIALIFIHHRFLDGRAPEVSKIVRKEQPPASAAATERRADLPRLSSGEKPYIVQTGDNYARIAAAEGVDEGDLRQVNDHVDIGPGLILRIPPKRIVAEEPPEVAAIRANSQTGGDRGLVEAVDVNDAPRAILVRPNSSNPTTPAASGKTHIVQPGESIFRIASRHKVSQDALMRANGITDPRKMRVGSRLVIPVN